MYEYPLFFIGGHLFIEVEKQKWLVDTGAPSSFGLHPNLQLANQSFSISENYMGLTPEKLSEYVNVECDGLLGVDVLNKFDLIFDVANDTLVISPDELSVDGEDIPLSEFMGIPIVAVKVGTLTYQMFFDTGAKLSYLQDSTITTYPNLDRLSDFYPGFGEFKTDTYLVNFVMGATHYNFQCGSLPELLDMTLMMSGTQGIIGNELFKEKTVGYFPRRGMLCL